MRLRDFPYLFGVLSRFLEGGEREGGNFILPVARNAVLVEDGGDVLRVRDLRYQEQHHLVSVMVTTWLAFAVCLSILPVGQCTSIWASVAFPRPKCTRWSLWEM